MCVKAPYYRKDMLVRAKIQLEGFDNATQPQKPHWESVRPVFALCHESDILSKQGISPVESKLEAIQQAPRPADVSQLRSFLSMINYSSKFIPDFPSKLHPLYELLSNKTKWFWSESCEAAFLWAKGVLPSDQVLVHYDPSKPLVLSVDAGPHGIGAVLSHRLGDGSEKPIEYASRTLSMAERNYAQIEKEGLAIVFGIKRFNLYLYGRKFTLFTDHQPLTRIFGPKSGIPPLAAARITKVGCAFVWVWLWHCL